MWEISSLFRNKTLKEKDYPHLCLYPFFNTMLTANGKYKPCCKWTENLTNKGKTLQAPKDSILDAFHADDMNLLRKDFLDGRKNSACEVCWSEEAQGIRSMRSDSFDYKLDASILVEIQYPKRLDLYMSNICNLKCRICSATYSSKWINEANETLGENETVHKNFTDTNFQTIKDSLHEIVELGLFGGEPLYNKETEELLQYCVDKGYSKNIQLLINTNGTIYSEKWVELFKRFKKVLLNFSIDDIDERFNYQRKGADWNAVNKNLKLYLSYAGVSQRSKIECKICCTVSSFNIFYLPEILRRLNDEFAGMQVYLNFLHGPYSLSIKNLPNDVKNLIRERLDVVTELNTGKGNNRTVENISNFIDLEPVVDFQEFFVEVRRGDQYRKENFEKTFPEFWEVIKSYELKP